MPGGGQPGEAEQRLAADLDRHLKALRAHHEDLAFRKAADEVRSIWRLANGYLAAQAPWSLFGRGQERAATVTRTGINLVAVAATISWPFIPEAAERVSTALGRPVSVPPWPWSAADALAQIEHGQRVGVLPVLFSKLTAEWSEEQQRQFAGGLHL